MDMPIKRNKIQSSSYRILSRRGIKKEKDKSSRNPLKILKIILIIIFVMGAIFTFNRVMRTRLYIRVETFILENTDIGKIKYIQAMDIENENLLNDDRLYKTVALMNYTVNDSLKLVNKYYNTEEALKSSLFFYENPKYLMTKETGEAYLKFKNHLREEGYEIRIFSAFRSIKTQKRIYSDEPDKSFVQAPGFSEHHTGLALDINPIAVESHKARAYNKMKHTAPMYGFILRYPKGKEKHTGISYEKWHFRYVGIPHSMVMDKLNLSLEEYTDYLKNRKVISIASRKGKYRIYYQKSKGQIRVPINSSFSISRIGEDEYVVTEVVN